MARARQVGRNVFLAAFGPPPWECGLCGALGADVVHLARLLDTEPLSTVPEREVAETVGTVQDVMWRDDFRVPLTASAKVLDRWGSAYRGDG